MKKACSIFTFLVLAAMVSTKQAFAANFTVSPASGTYDNGSQFEVIVGVTTGTSKMFAADVWATFDASKLEMVDVVRAYTSESLPTELSALRYLEVVKTAESIDNNAGTMKISIQNTQSTSYDTVALNNQPMLKITFKAKAVGTANFNFTCSQGSVNDSNIIDATTYEDIITCASNQSGLYTIGSSTSTSTGGDSTSTTTTTTSSTTTSSSSELPQTGAVEVTVGLGLLAVVLLTISKLLLI